MFIEILPHLLPPSLKLSPLQDLVPPSGDLGDNTLDSDYISLDDLLRDVSDYTGVLDVTANISVYHKNASGISTDLQVKGSVDPC